MYNIYFIYTQLNSNDYIISNELSRNVINSYLINLEELLKLRISNKDVLVFMNVNHVSNLNIKKYSCITIAWIINNENKWIRYLKNFKYIWCSSKITQSMYRNENIESIFIPICSEFNKLKENIKKEYDILIDVKL